MPGRAEELPSTVAGASLHKRDQSAKVLHLSSPQGVRRAGLDRDQQLKCGVQGAGGALGPRGREQAPTTPTVLRSEQSRAFQERGRRG